MNDPAAGCCTGCQAALQTLIAEVRGLRADLAAARSQRLSRAERRTLTAAAATIAGVLGKDSFTVRDLFDHPSPALRVLLENTDPKKFGWLLRRGGDVPLGKHMLERQGDDRGAAVWVVKILL